MNNGIYNRAYEMIANGFEFGQIQRGDTWERLIQGGPYSDIYTCAEKLEEEFGVKINVGLKYLKNAFNEYIQEHESEIYESKTNKNMKNNVIKLNESTLKHIVAESVKKVLNEIGDTKGGLGTVAQNVDRRTTQMNTVYNNGSSTVPQRMNAMGKSMDAQQYLAQAIQNAIANGMSEQEIEGVLKQNMSQNFNPTYSNGTLTWNRR